MAVNPIHYLALVVAGISWGVGFPLAKLTLTELGAAHMILARFIIASCLALPLILRTPESRKALADPRVILAGAVYGPAFLIQFEGVARATVSISALLVGAMPILVATAARVFLHEKVTRVGWAGIFTATAGAALLAGRPVGSSGLGVALILVSLVLCLGWIFSLRRTAGHLDPIAASCSAVVIATLVDLPIVVLIYGLPNLELSPVAWGGLIGQGAVSTVLALVTWQVGATHVPAATAGVFLNLEPLVGAMIGILFFNEALTLSVVAGGAAILLGSTLVALGRQPSRH